MDVGFESCESCIKIGMVKGMSNDEWLQRVCNWMNGYRGKILIWCNHLCTCCKCECL